jgi:hypothetical protein
MVAYVPFVESPAYVTAFAPHPNHRRLALAHLSHSDTAFLPPRSGSPFRNFAAAPEPVDLLVEEAQRRNG